MINGSSSDSRSILIVDDEVDLLALLKYNFEREGYTVVTVTNGIEALEAARRAAPDLVVLDIMMPGMDGIEVGRRLRRDPALGATPIIMLTARTEEEDFVRGLDAGADIYLGKPVSIPVLMSQVKALFRRSEQPDVSPDVLVVHGIEINRDRYVVLFDGREIRLPRKEFELLHYLARYPGRVFSRQELLDAVWGAGVYVVDRTVDVHVRKIREKLGSELIETVTGVGYKLRSE